MMKRRLSFRVVYSSVSRWMFVAAVLLSVSGCVSHRYVVRQPDRVVGNWEMIETTSVGTPIEVLLDNGSAVQGAYQSSGDSEVTILDAVGAETSLLKPQILEIRSTDADGLANGILIGMGLGALGGVVVKDNGGGTEGFWSNFGWTVGLGALFDALMAHYEVLYRAP
jgi:hypothetical protein